MKLSDEFEILQPRLQTFEIFSVHSGYEVRIDRVLKKRESKSNKFYFHDKLYMYVFSLFFCLICKPSLR